MLNLWNHFFQPLRSTLHPSSSPSYSGKSPGWTISLGSLAFQFLVDSTNGESADKEKRMKLRYVFSDVHSCRVALGCWVLWSYDKGHCPPNMVLSRKSLHKLACIPVTAPSSQPLETRGGYNSMVTSSKLLHYLLSYTYILLIPLYTVPY